MPAAPQAGRDHSMRCTQLKEQVDTCAVLSVKIFSAQHSNMIVITDGVWSSWGKCEVDSCQCFPSNVTASFISTCPDWLADVRPVKSWINFAADLVMVHCVTVRRRGQRGKTLSFDLLMHGLSACTCTAHWIREELGCVVDLGYGRAVDLTRLNSIQGDKGSSTLNL